MMLFAVLAECCRAKAGDRFGERCRAKTGIYFYCSLNLAAIFFSAGIETTDWNWNDTMPKTYEDQLMQQLLEYGFQMENICRLDHYNLIISKKVLRILLEWACYGQNEAGIIMGRKKISEIPKVWLRTHLIDAGKNDFEYWDDWNYRRLMEMVAEVVPDLKAPILSINSETDDPDLIDVINDFK